MSDLSAKVAGNRVLAWYTSHLVARPKTTQASTAAILCFLQEALASKLAGVPPPAIKATGIAPIDALKRVPRRAYKLALYGAFISAPISTALVSRLQARFAGRVDLRSKLLQMAAQSFIVSPLMILTYLTSASVIDGSRSIEQTWAYISHAFLRVWQQTGFANPAATYIAQNYLGPELWTPWYLFVSFVLATKINYDLKIKQIAAKAKNDAKD